MQHFAEVNLEYKRTRFEKARRLYNNIYSMLQQLFMRCNARASIHGPFVASLSKYMFSKAGAGWAVAVYTFTIVYCVFQKLLVFTILDIVLFCDITTVNNNNKIKKSRSTTTHYLGSFTYYICLARIILLLDFGTRFGGHFYRVYNNNNVRTFVDASKQILIKKRSTDVFDESVFYCVWSILGALAFYFFGNYFDLIIKLISRYEDNNWFSPSAHYFVSEICSVGSQESLLVRKDAEMTQQTPTSRNQNSYVSYNQQQQQHRLHNNRRIKQ